MSKSFRELFDNLDFYTTPVSSPPEGYSSGLALVAWKLFTCMMDANTTDGSRVSAIREIVDRYQGRPGPIQESKDAATREEIYAALDFDLLSQEEANLAGQLLARAGGWDNLPKS